MFKNRLTSRPVQCPMARLPLWAKYLLALAVPLLIVPLHRVAGISSAPMLFLLPILFCAHIGGLGPGVAATLCSMASLEYLLLSPGGGTAVALEQFQATMLLLVGLAISFLQSGFANANARFRALVDQSVAGIYVIEGDVFSYVNPAFARMFGYDGPDSLLGRVYFADLVAPKDRAQVVARVKQRAAGAVVDARYEFTALRRDGSTMEVEVHGRSFPNQGRAAVIGILLDISERKQLAEALRRQQAELEEAVAARTLDLDRALVEVRQNEARYRAVFDRSKVPMLLIDPHEGAVVEANRAACAYYGYDWEHICRLRISDINTLTQAEVEAEMIRADREMRHQFFFRHRLASGEVRDVEVYSGPLEIDGRHMLYSIIHDISQRVQAERQLRDLNRDFVTLLENTSDYIYFKDQESRFRFCSQTLARLTGHQRWQDMIGKHDRDVFPPDMAKVYSEEERPIFAQGQPLLDRIDPYLDEQGAPGWVSTNKWPVWDEAHRQVVGLFGISRVVTERIRMEVELREMATTDALTGLANRRQFLARLELQLAGMRRHLMPYAAVLMLDLDHFKHVNDMYGHGVGDDMLRHVAALMRDSVRKIDLAGRVGGEEFALLLPGSSLEAARIFAERLRQALADAPLVTADGQRIPMTASIGVATLEASDEGVDASLARADQALYEAKSQGRNRVASAPSHGEPMLLAAPKLYRRTVN